MELKMSHEWDIKQLILKIEIHVIYAVVYEMDNWEACDPYKFCNQTHYKLIIICCC